jgi:hypothetical protein
MEPKKTTEMKTSFSPAVVVSSLFLVSGMLELWAFYATGFRMFTLLILAVAGFVATYALIRTLPWRLWLSSALYLIQLVQAIALLWSSIATEGFRLSAYSLSLQIGILAYIVVFTVFTALLSKRKT